MKCIVFIFLALMACTSHAQPHARIGKSTHAGSTRSSIPAGKWVRKYLPTDEADDDCPSATCTCGTQGRSALKMSTSGNEGVSPGFGLHVVDSRGQDDSRAKANGGLTVEQVEDIFTENINNWTNYDTSNNTKAWADYHTSLWADDGLDSYLAAFKKDKVPFHLGSWKDKTNTTLYWSILVQTPNTQLILELQGKCDDCSSESGASIFEERRGVAKQSFGKHLMSAVQVSRSVKSVDEIITFYKLVFGINPVDTQKLHDGTKIVDLEIVSGAVRLRFVERPGQQTLPYTTLWFQGFLNSAIAKYMTSYNSCWPVWGDNHWGGSGGQNLADIVSIFDKNKYPYHLFTMRQGQVTNGYFYEPSGWQMQLNGRYTNPPSDIEPFMPNLCFTSCLHTS